MQSSVVHPVAPPAFTELQRLIETVPTELARIPADLAGKKPAPCKWSKKEELGHLIDSAANNHQRIVRAAVHCQRVFPGYLQNEWVDLHAYRDADWPEEIQLWHTLNRHLLRAAAGVSAEGWTRICEVEGVADGVPSSLALVFADYVNHLKHHLQHIGLALSDAA